MVGIAVAVGVSAGTATGQLWVGRQWRVVVPDQEYSAGTDTWPFQLVLLVWCAASAAALGAACARPILGEVWWRYAAVVPAGVGALAPLEMATSWAAGAGLSADPVAGATKAMLVGALVGACIGVTVLVRPAAARCLAVWVGFVWLCVAGEVALDDPVRPGESVVPAHPLGLLTPSLEAEDTEWLVGLLPPVLLAAVLGWWVARRGERWPLYAAVVGPLLMIAVHAAVPPLPGGDSDGDHYLLRSDLMAWVLVTALGAGVAALGALVGRRWSGRDKT
ncbi:hypothetical protein [Actinomadura chokoriensis]|uniref:Uncharacterized protein n=1 Tax=Actinomadura chokoriensis TaxID=454156 RepID=A0ABV4QUB6_9ACTN